MYTFFVEVIHCTTRTCKNNGKCIKGLKHFECKCPFEYKGEICSGLQVHTYIKMIINVQYIIVYIV